MNHIFYFSKKNRAFVRKNVLTTLIQSIPEKTRQKER